ncbi:MAG: purine-nucleoside phosphorylase, partial [candidate division WOR-3 bacterium]
SRASAIKSEKTMSERVNESVTAISGLTRTHPEVGVILGTGLGGLESFLEVESAIPYSGIPHFPRSTAPGHANRLLTGRIGGRAVLMFQGRVHYYEGYGMAQVTFPVRVVKSLGAHWLIVSNACGAVNPEFQVSDIVSITDHVNLMGDNPLRGTESDAPGPRFPVMLRAYDPDLIRLAEKVASELGLRLRKGVYVGLSGPSLETAAEYRMVRRLGGDMVGMSTVPEVIVARQIGLRVLGLSVVTNTYTENECEGETDTALDVLLVAQRAVPELGRLVSEVIRRL